MLAANLLLEQAQAQLHGLTLACPRALEQEQGWEFIGIGWHGGTAVARQTPFPLPQLFHIEQFGHEGAATWLAARAVIVIVGPTVGVFERHALAL
ncbi:hypothetical protein D3C79_858180 [compost metagenome]